MELMRTGELAYEGEERQVHRYDAAADGHSEEAYHDGFYKGQQVGYGRVYFLFVEVRYLAEHGVEGARLLAYAYHLRDHVREDLCGFQRVHEAFAALDARPHFEDGLFYD